MSTRPIDKILLFTVRIIGAQFSQVKGYFRRGKSGTVILSDGELGWTGVLLEPSVPFHGGLSRLKGNCDAFQADLCGTPLFTMRHA